MRIFADTANLEEIRELKSWGVIDGVTTNPTLLSRESGDPFETLVQICEVVDGPVSAEVISTDSSGMIEEGKKLASLHKHIVIKIPMTVDGLKATRVLTQEGINVNMTLVFTPTQAILAAKAGARYISPFIGRLDDISSYGIELIGDLIAIISNYDFDSEVLVASVRHPMHVVEAAKIGAPIVTVPPKVIRQLVNHPLTDIGLKKFIEDWQKIGQKI